mmetsp:Transcript_132243/g.382338  ORF Transcript_132243/g.382338 Transcript_132243/m.382338 type:complete len:224 (-) Transcript_132243:286-957(-)
MKVVLIGDSSVGKTALVHRFIHNKPLAETKATVGIAFFKQHLVDSETGEDYTLQIWDTAGQEKFQSVTTHHYRAADGALLVFDVSNESSFLRLDKWLAELRENTEPSVVVALVGTKVDLSHRRTVPFERAQAYAKANGLLYMETSALWDKYQGNDADAVAGVERVFLRVLRAVVQQQKDNGRNPERLDISGYGPERRGKEPIQLGGEARGRHTAAAGGSSCEC